MLKEGIPVYILGPSRGSANVHQWLNESRKYGAHIKNELKMATPCRRQASTIWNILSSGWSWVLGCRTNQKNPWRQEWGHAGPPGVRFVFALILDGLALAKELALALGVSTLGAEMRTIVAMASGHFRQVAELLRASVLFSPRYHRSIFLMGLPWEIREHTGGVDGGNCSRSALSLTALWRWPWRCWCQRPWWQKWEQIILLQAQRLPPREGSASEWRFFYSADTSSHLGTY